MRPKNIEDILVYMHTGQWFGFGGKEKIYANLIIHSDDEKPTQEWLEIELKSQQDAYDNDHARKRKEEYAPVGDQLDSILKWANLMRMDGTNLPEDLDQTIAQWLSVKQKHPKS